MSEQEKNCQPLVTEIRDVVDPYVAEVYDSSSFSKTPPGLTLNRQQLLVFSALSAEKRKGVVLVVSARLRAAEKIRTELSVVSSFLSDNQTWHLIEGGLSLQEEAGDVVSNLSQTLHHFLRGTSKHSFVIPGHLLEHPFPSRAAYAENYISLHKHESNSLSRFIHSLIDRGYTRYPAAQEPGSFSVRGEQVDLILPTTERYTITFHGSVVEQIVQHWSAASGAARQQVLNAVTIPPTSFPPATTPLAELAAHYTTFIPHEFQTLLPEGLEYDALETSHPFPLTPTHKTPRSRTVYVVYENHDRVATYANDHDLSSALLCQHELARVPLALEHERFALVTERALFKAEPPAPRPDYQGGLLLAQNLTLSAPAVHTDHGIGIFEGLQTRVIDSRPKEYLILRYAAGDMLSVPVEYAHKVTPYIGEETPIIHRLGGTLWSKTRRRAQHDAEAFARELLGLAGERAGGAAERYTIYSDVKDSLEKTFPFTLTPDQEAALAAIEEDLQGPHFVDRLVVGDVGFGKTELALRAARHVIANGKQVALLAPTTLLVQQHADTAEQRFPDLKEKIGVLSRFASPTEQAATREKIAEGSLQLVIGTHALLTEKTKWHNLGLVIIDEEQRFGVKHKEHFKKIRATVDFLSLSATPIPRTLSMALSGLKELSVISTPPIGRKEVVTRVTRQHDAVLREALERELSRNGQAYVVAPHVRKLASLAHEVQKIAPKASIAVAHGQLTPAELARTMRQFDRGEVKILVTSSIIENGLDVPGANTIVVMQATHFGLSDLYQLRGRVGRRDRQGYAYFLYNQHELTAVQRRRLTALTEASRLGSGWSLAQRDLEIRGAGNLLGAEQSGTASQVGAQLYLDMVHEAIDQQRDGVVRRIDTEIKLPLVALIPHHYIANDDVRSRYYQQLSRAKKPEDIEKLAADLAAAYGELPPEVHNLILVLKLQHCAAAAGISEITTKKITPSDEDPYWRLVITTKKVTEVLQKLQPLGRWSVRNNILTHDLNAITPDFLKQLLSALA